MVWERGSMVTCSFVPCHLDLSKVPTKVLRGPRFGWISPPSPKLLNLLKFQIYLGILCLWILCMGLNIHICFCLWDLRKPFVEAILFCPSVRILFLNLGFHVQREWFIFWDCWCLKIMGPHPANYSYTSHYGDLLTQKLLFLKLN